MIPVTHDYETKSGKDIIQHGRVVHLRDPQADIIYLSYKIGKAPTALWKPGLPPPDCFVNPEPYHFFAFNAQFDWAVTNLLGRKYGFAKQRLDQITDVMALCGRYSYPQGLDKVAKAMGLALAKDTRGKALMKKICAPPFKATKQEYIEFGTYCIRDTDLLYLIMQHLPSLKLSNDLRNKWEHTVRVNLRGLPIDIAAVTRINEVVQYCLKKEGKKVPLLTDGQVQTIGQTEAIKTYCRRQGVVMPDLQKATVAEILGCDDTPRKVREILQLRQDLGGAAVKKYAKLLKMVDREHIYDNLRFWGAGPGRFSGMGFQAQNLPRLSVDDPAAEIQKFYDTSILKEKPLHSAKALIRSMIRAPKGKTLIAADYKSVEYVLAIWWAGETELLEKFVKGICPYKKQAAELNGKPYEEITKQERTEAKPVKLGGQYLMGWKALIEYAKNFGVKMDEGRARFAIEMYRHKHRKIVATWNVLKRKSIQAVMHPGIAYPYKNVVFMCVTDRSGTPWLRMTLPSGRHLFYCEPAVGEGKFGPVVHHMGVDPKTKQWKKKWLPPNRLIENIIQGLGWDLMMHGIQKVDPVYPVILSVHDEIVTLADKDKADLSTMIKLICSLPAWAKGLPLQADGWIGERYRKD